MWHHEMSADEINSKTCNESGSISSMYTLQERGRSVNLFDKMPKCGQNSEKDSVIG